MLVGLSFCHVLAIHILTVLSDSIALKCKIMKIGKM